VIQNLVPNTSIETHVVLIASAASKKYGKLEQYLFTDGVKVNWKIESQLDAALKSGMVSTTALSMIGISDYILNNQIDGTLVIADRHETIAGAIASSYLNCKTFHLLGGETSGNIDNKVRYANTFLSDYHFVATKESKSRLELCGIAPELIFQTGCPSLDFLQSSNMLDIVQITEYFGGVGLSVQKLFQGRYVVVLQHAETTSDLDARLQVRSTIDAIDKLSIPALWIWPNSDTGSDEIIREIASARESGKLKNVHFERNLDPELFISILKNSSCIIGNSSVAIRECSLLGVPAVNIGGRQNNRERAPNVIDSDYNFEEIYETVSMQIKNGFYKPSKIYGDGHSGQRISNLLSSLL